MEIGRQEREEKDGVIRKLQFEDVRVRRGPEGLQFDLSPCVRSIVLGNMFTSSGDSHNLRKEIVF